MSEMGFYNDMNTITQGDMEGAASRQTESMPGLFLVGEYNDIKGYKGLDAHHIGQKALMAKFVIGYNPETGPAINVPKEGHTIRGISGVVSRSKKDITNAKELLDRDISELRRVYPEVPQESVDALIKLNKDKYSEMRD